MGVLTRMKQARWYIWIVVPLAIFGALGIAGRAIELAANWGAYREARKIAVSRNLTIPGFREYQHDREIGLDPLFGQMNAQTINKDGSRAISELLPLEEQAKAREALAAFQNSSRLILEGELLLGAERIDEIHLILRDPKHHTPDELRSWLNRVKDLAYIQGFKQ